MANDSSIEQVANARRAQALALRAMVDKRANEHAVSADERRAWTGDARGTTGDARVARRSVGGAIA
jgi:hypothetical protein